MTVFRALVLAGVTASCATTIYQYAGMSYFVVILNFAVPPVLWFYLRRGNFNNRLGHFLLLAPLIFLLELCYILIRSLPLNVDLATNLLAAMFLVNGTLFALFGDQCSGHLRRHMDKLVLLAAALYLLAYGLIRTRYRFPLLPYATMFVVMVVWYRVLVGSIRSKDRMLREEHMTLVNTRMMARGHIHDINNYLTSVVGLVTLGLSARGDDERRKRFAEKADAVATRLQVHLRKLVGLLNDEKQIVTLTTLRVPVLLKQLEQFLEEANEQGVMCVRGRAPSDNGRGLVLVCPLIPPRESVMADTHLLCNAIHNLVANARKAGATKIRVVVDTEMHADKLVLRVQDNGPGIPREKANVLFRHAVDSRDGAGVGLLGVRSIIECHGARIAVTAANSDGGGLTEFSIDGLRYVR